VTRMYEPVTMTVSTLRPSDPLAVWAFAALIIPRLSDDAIAMRSDSDPPVAFFCNMAHSRFQLLMTTVGKGSNARGHDELSKQPKREHERFHARRCAKRSQVRTVQLRASSFPQSVRGVLVDSYRWAAPEYCTDVIVNSNPFDSAIVA
jgi:hypothetical protein